MSRLRALGCRLGGLIGFRLAAAYNPLRSMTLAPGAQLGSYEVISALGAGGMGEVYRARDTKLGRKRRDQASSRHFRTTIPIGVARFKREAQILAALNHPHIAGIHGLEEANGSAFLVPRVRRR